MVEEGKEDKKVQQVLRVKEREEDEKVQEVMAGAGRRGAEFLDKVTDLVLSYGHLKNLSSHLC